MCLPDVGTIKTPELDWNNMVCTISVLLGYTKKYIWAISVIYDFSLKFSIVIVTYLALFIIKFLY